MKFEEDNAIFDTPFGITALFKDPDAKPVYQGRGVARGIKCDVWRQIRINWPGDAQAYTIWRWFFTEKEGEESLLVRILIIESCYFLSRETQCVSIFWWGNGQTYDTHIFSTEACHALVHKIT